MSAIKNAIGDYVEFATRDVLPLAERWRLQDHYWDKIGDPDSIECADFYRWTEQREKLKK